MQSNVLVLTPVGDFRGGAERSVLPCVEALAEAGYYVVMTIFFNPLFVDELVKVLPVKIGNIVSKIRNKLKFTYAI